MSDAALQVLAAIGIPAFLVLLVGLTVVTALGIMVLLIRGADWCYDLRDWVAGLWWRVPVGTRSLLIGAHAFWLHPFVLAVAWTKLYGFPWDPRLWVAFFVHDLGYWGKPNMDGDEGETHPILGARIMTWLFDAPADRKQMYDASGEYLMPTHLYLGPWGKFSLLHSRYFAKRYWRQNPSSLCLADKLAIALTPTWLYVPMVRLTGEVDEYLAKAHERVAAGEPIPAADLAAYTSDDPWQWYPVIQRYARSFVAARLLNPADSWTPAPRGR